eukprot:967996-Prorocentrum_lima.AAC.1
MAETERQVSEAEDEWMRELHERRDEEMRLSKALHQQHKKQRATLSSTSQELIWRTPQESGKCQEVREGHGR